MFFISTNLISAEIVDIGILLNLAYAENYRKKVDKLRIYW